MNIQDLEEGLGRYKRASVFNFVLCIRLQLQDLRANQVTCCKLTGSQDAVLYWRTNAPSLMSRYKDPGAPARGHSAGRLLC